MPVSRFRSILILSPILFSIFILSACSSLESARYQRQAEQFAAEGKFPEAVLTYRQALISDPDNPELLSGLGMALAAQGRNRFKSRLHWRLQRHIADYMLYTRPLWAYLR